MSSNILRQYFLSILLHFLIICPIHILFNNFEYHSTQYYSLFIMCNRLTRIFHLSPIKTKTINAGFSNCKLVVGLIKSDIFTSLISLTFYVQQIFLRNNYTSFHITPKHQKALGVEVFSFSSVFFPVNVYYRLTYLKLLLIL